MYSIILLTAMTTTAETPTFGDTWSKHCFWESCLPARYGWVACGPGYQPIYPTASYSCCGCGGYHMHHVSTCHGCWGGACHGCWGGACHGGYANSCQGHTCYGCYGGYGGYPIFAGIGYAGFGAYGNFGMYGAVPYYAAPMYATPTLDPQQRVYRPSETRPLDPRPREMSPLEIRPIEIKPRDANPRESKPIEKRLGSSMKKSASVVVKVPAEAKVYIDGNLMSSTSRERVFTSPQLQPDEAFFYTLRVVVEKNGKEIEESRRVTVRAGEVSRLNFDSLGDENGRALVDAFRKPID